MYVRQRIEMKLMIDGPRVLSGDFDVVLRDIVPLDEPTDEQRLAKLECRHRPSPKP